MTIEIKLPDEKDVQPFEFAPEFGSKLIKFQLDDSRLAIREGIANGLDAQPFGKERISIEITNDKITIEDWGHGIKSWEDFKLQGRSLKHIEGAIGRFGIGKLSMNALGRKVIYNTNNGKYGMSILITDKGMTPPIYGGMTDFLGHQGTQIIITDLKSGLSSTDFISKIKERFSIRIIKGAKITLNGQETKQNFKYTKVSPFEKHIQSMRGGAKITGQMIADEEGDGALDVYVNYIFITRVIIDPSRAFTGWVNCDVLPLHFSRSQFILDDQIYKEFLSRLQQEAMKFKKKELLVAERTMSFLENMRDLLAKYLKDNNCMPFAKILRPKITGSEEMNKIKTDDKGGEDIGEGGDGCGDDLGHTQKGIPLKERIKAKGRKKHDIKYVIVYEGIKAPAVYWNAETPNVIYINKTHPITEHYDKVGRSTHGLNLTMMRYFARIATQINPKTKEMSELQKYAEEDKVLVAFLKGSSWDYGRSWQDDEK